MRPRSKSFHFDKNLVSDSESEAEHETDENEDEETSEEWSVEETMELLENIKRNYKERNKSYILSLKKLDWAKIATTRTAKETQTYFMDLLKKVRKVRSLTEILNDPITINGNPRSGQQNVYTLWTKDNIELLRAKAGSSSITEMAKAGKTLYAQVTPEEKERYRAMLPPPAAKKHTISKRVTAFNLYHKHRLENKKVFEILSYPQVRLEWKNLPIKEKIPFVREVFVHAQQSGEEAQVTRWEQKILNSEENRPIPPQNAFELFKSEIRDSLGDNMIENTKKASALYRKLPEKKMKEYEDKAKKLKEEYVESVAQWMLSLPDGRREFEIAGMKESCNRKSAYNKTMTKLLLAKIATSPVRKVRPNNSLQGNFYSNSSTNKPLLSASPIKFKTKRTTESANGSSTDNEVASPKPTIKRTTVENITNVGLVPELEIKKKKIQKIKKSKKSISETEVHNENESDSESVSLLIPLETNTPDIKETKSKKKKDKIANEGVAQANVKNKKSKSVKENEVPNQDLLKVSSKSKQIVPGKVIAKAVIRTPPSSEDESPPMKISSPAKAPLIQKIKSEPSSSENESIANKKAKTSQPVGDMPEFGYNTPYEFWKGNVFKGKTEAAELAYAKLSEKTKKKHMQQFQLKQTEYLNALKDYLAQLPAASLREISSTKMIKSEKDVVIEASDDSDSESESETDSDE